MALRLLIIVCSAAAALAVGLSGQASPRAPHPLNGPTGPAF
jgi:hypothetical protein